MVVILCLCLACRWLLAGECVMLVVCSLFDVCSPVVDSCVVGGDAFVVCCSLFVVCGRLSDRYCGLCMVLC